MHVHVQMQLSRSDQINALQHHDTRAHSSLQVHLGPIARLANLLDRASNKLLVVGRARLRAVPRHARLFTDYSTG